MRNNFPFHKSQGKSSGFTLVELLVVITILGVLAAISFTSYTQYQKRARDAQRKFDMRTVQSALEAYYADQTTPGYPQGDWAAMVTALTGSTKYLKTPPQDPAVGGTYYYVGQGTCTSGKCPTFFICAKLENTSDPDIAAPAKYPCTPNAAYNYGLNSQ